MSMPMLIELSAFNAITSNFQLFIQEEMGNKILVKHVSANIVPLDLFKNVSKSLRLEDKPIYRHGVSLGIYLFYYKLTNYLILTIKVTIKTTNKLTKYLYIFIIS